MHLKSLASDYCALDMMQGKWICFSFQILRISGPRQTLQENTLFKKRQVPVVAIGLMFLGLLSKEMIGTRVHFTRDLV